MTPKTKTKFTSLAVASFAAVMLASTGAFADNSGNNSSSNPNTPQAQNKQEGQQQPGVAGQQQDVKKVQTALKDQGFDVGSVDGIMGPKTESALKQYQEKKGLSATGQLDQQTRSDLGIG